jgi:hypothetical protein
VWTGFGERDKLATFRGAATSISFSAATGLGPGRYGLEMLSITVDASADGRALVRRRAPLIGTTFGSFQDPVVLLSGPFQYVFKYYARDGQELPVWDSQIELPARVKLMITDHRGPIFSAPVELPILASLSAGCLVSANPPSCPVQARREQNEWMKQYGLIPEDR